MRTRTHSLTHAQIPIRIYAHALTHAHICTHTHTNVHPPPEALLNILLLNFYLTLFVHRIRQLIEEQIEMFFCLSECVADQLAVSQLDDHVRIFPRHDVYVRQCHSSMEMPNL